VFFFVLQQLTSRSRPAVLSSVAICTAALYCLTVETSRFKSPQHLLHVPHLQPRLHRGVPLGRGFADQDFGVLHFVDGLLLDVVGEFCVSPVLAISACRKYWLMGG
jgi:hypothetical protein